MVRSPADLLACVVLALGFVPERSVVVLSLPPGRGPHARVDLVDELGEVPAMARALVRPALRHGVRRVAVVVTAALPWATQVAPVLERAFEEAGVEVAALVAADGTHWLSLRDGQRTTVPREYDVLSHPFVADAVLRGQVVLASRDAVRASVEPVVDLVAAVAGEVDRGAGRRRGAAWVRTVLEQALRTGRGLSPRDVADLVASLDDVDARDAAWAWAGREHAREHVDLWLRVVRSCPDEGAAAPAAVLAFHAWLAGDGALAWCALDRAGRAGRRTTLAALVEDLLEGAASPELWSARPGPFFPLVGARGDGKAVSPGADPEGEGVAPVVDLDTVRRGGTGRGTGSGGRAR